MVTINGPEFNLPFPAREQDIHLRIEQHHDSPSSPSNPPALAVVLVLVAVVHTRVPVARVIPGVRPRAVSRHEMTPAPVVLANALAARHRAALPVAKGPSALVQAGAFNASVAPDCSSRLAQACGSRVMH